MQSLRSYLLAYIKVVQKLKFIVEWVLPSNWKCDDFSRSMNSREDLHIENSAFPYMLILMSLNQEVGKCFCMERQQIVKIYNSKLKLCSHLKVLVLGHEALEWASPALRQHLHPL